MSIQFLGNSYEQWFNVLGLDVSTVKDFVVGKILSSICKESVTADQRRQILEMTDDPIIRMITTLTQANFTNKMKKHPYQRLMKLLQKQLQNPKKTKKAKKPKKAKKAKKSTKKAKSSIEFID